MDALMLLCQQTASWPDVVTTLGSLALFGFVIWVLFR